MAVTKIDSKKIPVTPKKRGRPLGSTNKPVNWEALAKKLQRALAAEINRNDELSWQVETYKDLMDNLHEQIYKLENRSWLSRTFNLKG